MIQITCTQVTNARLYSRLLSTSCLWEYTLLSGVSSRAQPHLLHRWYRLLRKSNRVLHNQSRRSKTLYQWLFCLLVDVSPVHKSATLSYESLVLRNGTEQDNTFFPDCKFLTTTLQDTQKYINEIEREAPVPQHWSTVNNVRPSFRHRLVPCTVDSMKCLLLDCTILQQDLNQTYSYLRPVGTAAIIILSRFRYPWTLQWQIRLCWREYYA